jgi:hypothetical protein
MNENLISSSSLCDDQAEGGVVVEFFGKIILIHILKNSVMEAKEYVSF